MTPTTQTPVTVVASFHLTPASRSVWEEAWSEIADMARSQQCCHRFVLLADRHDSNHCTVLTEWDDVDAFDQFVQDAHVLWMERGLEYSCSAPTYTYLEAISSPNQPEVAAAPCGAAASTRIS